MYTFLIDSSKLKISGKGNGQINFMDDIGSLSLKFYKLNRLTKSRVIDKYLKAKSKRDPFGGWNDN